MKNLLLNEYPAHFGANGRYDISSVENQGTFPLNDEKACRECRGQNKQQCSEEDADRHMLLHADHPVTVVDIEGFLNQFDGKKAALKDRRIANIKDARRLPSTITPSLVIMPVSS